MYGVAVCCAAPMQLDASLADAWMRDGVELSARLGISEHPCRHALAVERAVRLQDFFTKGAHDFGQALAAFLHDLAGQSVGVDHRDTQRLQLARDHALA